MLDNVISRNALLLGLFAAATTAGIAGTYLGTKDIIAEQKRKAEQAALVEVVPLSRHNNSMLDETIAVDNKQYLELSQSKSIYVAKQDGDIVSFIIPAIAPEGYTDKMGLIVGVNLDGTIAGVRVLTHRETPGLGDKVELSKSDWVLSFNGKSLSNPDASGWKVKKDKGEFDQFTGATITPRAITKAVYQTLLYFQANKAELVAKAEQLRSPQEQ